MSAKRIEPVEVDLDLGQLIRKVIVTNADGTKEPVYYQYEDEIEFLMLVRPLFSKSHGIRKYVENRLRELRAWPITKFSQKKIATKWRKRYKDRATYVRNYFPEK